MINILFLETGSPTIDGGAGGSVYSLLEIVKGIHKENFRISVLFYNHFNITNKFEKLGCEVIIKNKQVEKKVNNNKVLNNKNVGASIKWIKSNLGLRKLVPDIKYIINIIKENNIQLIHCNDRLSTNISGIIAAKLVGIKVIVHQRQYETNLPFYMKYFSKKVDLFFAISNSIAEDLLLKSSVKKRNVKVLFNWISSLPQNSIKLRTNKKKILWLGRIVPWKGTHLLIEIVENLQKSNADFDQIVIYGEADKSSMDYLASIKEKIDKKNLNSYFDFRGYKVFEQIDTSEFKAYFHTSLAPEPFGRTLIEAMNSSLPVFATNLGGVKDIIKDKVNGFLYDPQNTMELIHKFSLLDNNNILNDICTNGIKTVKEKFSGENQITTIVNCYKSFNK